MEQALLFIEENQAWIYILLLLAGLIYLRQTLRGLHETRAALFGLEREGALRKLTRSVSMLVLTVGSALAVFIVTTFLAPSIPASTAATPLPTVSYLGTPGQGEAGIGREATNLAEGSQGVDFSGCLNPQATITSPENGETIKGILTVSGTANIPSFAFYKLEYRSLQPGEKWRAIIADTKPVVDDVLGTWDTSLLQSSGEYQFRLVVADTAGNGPLPCTIQLRIVSGT